MLVFEGFLGKFEKQIFFEVQKWQIPAIFAISFF